MRKDKREVNSSKTYVWRLGLMVLIGLTGLTGCSDDSEEGRGQRVTIEAQSCAVGYAEETGTRGFGATRSDPQSPTWPPDGYYLYDGLNSQFAGRKDLMGKSIGVFFAQSGSATPEEGTFFYSDYDSNWHMSNTEISSGNYFLYGFIPTEDADHATISSTDYSNGAVLTIHDLDAVTPSDVCVIIGAKDGTASDVVTGLQAGSFNTTLKPMGTSASTGNNNFIFLLFDHLYSALRFNFLVDSEYAKLRTIKLRQLELVAYSDDSGGAVKAKYNVTISLQKTTDGSSPITGVTFTPDQSSGNVAPVSLYDWENEPARYLTLSDTEPTSFMGSFVPGNLLFFKLRSTYDVFDRQGNLIRERCQAENTFDLRTKFGSYTSATRGHSYSYTITVQPTYIYVLSEPDLDNPTMVISN